MNVSLIALGFLYLLAFITCIVILLNTQNPSKALLYILLVIVMPIVGIPLYFTIGVNYRKQKLYQKKLEIGSNRYEGINSYKDLLEYSKEQHEKLKKTLYQYAPLAQFHNVENVLTKENNIKILVNGENKYPRLFEDIKNAKESIHLEYYIYESDKVGEKIGSLLKQKADEGLTIRLIYDDFGSNSLKKKYIKDLQAHGIKMVPFYKIKWMLFANGINYRNHRKIVVIDGRIGYVGGINMATSYDNDYKNKLYWRDTHIRIAGPAALPLQLIFLEDWNFCSEEKVEFSKEYFPNDFKPVENGKLTQIIASGPDSDNPSILYSIMQAVMLSRKELLITTPYFIPDQSLVDCIKIAALSGVDVKVLVPKKSDSLLVNDVASSYYQTLLDSGVEIYMYTKGFVHAKSIICDSKVSIIGTANLDQRSFDLNFEVNAIVYDDLFAEDMRKVFFDDLKHAEKIDPEEWKNRPIFIRVFQSAARLLSPLM